MEPPFGIASLAFIDKIEDGELKLVRVGRDFRQAERETGFDLDGCAERTLQQLRHAVDEFGDIDGLELELLAPGKRQHALRQRRAALSTLQGVVDELVHLAVAGWQAAFHELKTALDGHQQVIEVMGDAAGQMTDRLHLLRLHQCFPRAFEGLFRFLAFGDVPRDLGEADKHALAIADRVDDDVRPELRAVLADAKAFSFESPFTPRCFKRDRGKPGLAVFLGIKDREVLADDLFRLVALDPFRARVPACDHCLPG